MSYPSFEIVSSKLIVFKDCLSIMSSEKKSDLNKDDEEIKQEEDDQSTAMSIFWGVFKTISLLTLLYFFICSITFLEDAFKLVSGQNAGMSRIDHK